MTNTTFRVVPSLGALVMLTTISCTQPPMGTINDDLPLLAEVTLRVRVVDSTMAGVAGVYVVSQMTFPAVGGSGTTGSNGEAVMSLKRLTSPTVAPPAVFPETTSVFVSAAPLSGVWKDRVVDSIRVQVVFQGRNLPVPVLEVVLQHP